MLVDQETGIETPHWRQGRMIEALGAVVTAAFADPLRWAFWGMSNVSALRALPRAAPYLPG